MCFIHVWRVEHVMLAMPIRNMPNFDFEHLQLFVLLQFGLVIFAVSVRNFVEKSSFINFFVRFSLMVWNGRYGLRNLLGLLNIFRTSTFNEPHQICDRTTRTFHYPRSVSELSCSTGNHYYSISPPTLVAILKVTEWVLKPPIYIFELP